MIKKKAILFLWILLGFAAIALFFIGAKNKGEKLCKGVNIEVTERARQVFIDLQGIKIEIIENGGKPGLPVGQISLNNIETHLKKDAWIKDVKLYFDNNQVLQADIKESDPVARVFTAAGNSFYIDSNARYLPVNSNIVARVPVFTGFPSDKDTLSAPDSALLSEIKIIANFVIKDTFWSAFISQVNILPNTQFQIIPTLGNQVIGIGNANHLNEKFNRLYSFYRQVLDKTGIEKYSNIDVQYAGQVVASEREKHIVTNVDKAVPSGTIKTATAKPPPTIKKTLPSKITTSNNKTTKNKNK